MLARFLPCLCVLLAACTEPSGTEVANPARPATEPAEAPFVHDHTPHHGGVVGMVEDAHIEALALADGTLRFYLTDRWRKPLALESAHGRATVGSGDDAPTIALARTAAALEGKARPPSRATIDVRVEVEVGGAPLSMDFVLPVGARSGGAVGVPLEGCVAPLPGATAPGTPRRRRPRCVLTFANEVTALAIAPDASRLLLSAVDVGTSAWRLPDVTLELGWDAPPPVVMAEPEAPHREAANALVVSPDSTRALLALEARLLEYSLADGKVRAQLGSGRGIVRNVAWSSDGALLLVTRFYDQAASLLRASDGSVVRTLPLSAQAAAVAFEARGALAAVGTRSGEIALFDTADGERRRVLRAGTRTVEALAFVRDASATKPRRLVSGGADGVLRIWNVESGEETARHDLGAALYRIAASPSGSAFATGDRAGCVRLHAEDGVVIETLTDARDGVSVLDLALAGTTLVASDSTGAVAVWDLDAR